MNPTPRFMDLLYGSRPAEFTSAFGIEHSVERLRSGLARWPAEQKVAVGRVSANRVVLRRVAMMGVLFVPVFTGHFETRREGVVLVGKFSQSRFTKVFMSMAFGFAALWTCVCTVLMLTAQGTPRQVEVDIAGHHEAWLAWVFPLSGIAMFLVGVLMVREEPPWRSEDQAWLSDHIARELEASPGPTINPASE